MNPVRVVVDTNVLVSGLLSVHGPPARVVDFLLARRLMCVHDDRITDEYRRVLSRARFAAVINTRDRESVLLIVRRFGLAVTALPLPGLRENAPDPDDLPFAEAAVAGGAVAVITGNTAHFGFFQDNPWGVDVWTPREAVRRLSEGG